MDELIDQISYAETYRVEKPWGEEFVIKAEEFIIKLITVNDHNRTSLQHHVHKREVSVVISGRGGVRVSGELQGGTSRPSTPVVIDPMTVHRTHGRCMLLEVTTPDDDDIVRHEDDWDRS